MNRSISRLQLKKSGLLTILAVVFIASGLARTVPIVRPAFAIAETADQSNNKTQIDDLSTLLSTLQQREAALRQKEQELLDKERSVSLSQSALVSKLDELEAAEARLSNTMAIAESIFEEDLQRLTKVYEQMKPKQSAALFEEMDPQFAAGFLGRMQPAISAGILAALTPKTAYSISVVMAGRNASVPRLSNEQEKEEDQ